MQYSGATIPALVVHDLVVALISGDTSELVDSAQALGVLRGTRGARRARSSRTCSRCARRSGAGSPPIRVSADDGGELVMLLQRSTELVDAALRAAISAFVAESQRVLSVRATRDQLTGLLNRAAFDEALTRELAARSEPPSVLLVDLDGFKQVNDRLGHLAGDAVLVAVGALMMEACRGGDVIGRMGGDEFAVLLPATHPEDAERVAQRMLAAAQRSEDLAPRGAARVGMSIGLCWLPRPATAEEMLHAADEAMYTAKRAGGSALAVSPKRRVSC